MMVADPVDDVAADVVGNPAIGNQNKNGPRRFNVSLSLLIATISHHLKSYISSVLVS